MNPRSAQLLAAALAALLIVLVGATIFVLLNQRAGPTPTPGPTDVAIASSSLSPFASVSPSPSFASPSPTAGPSLEPTPSPSAEPTPTEPPTPSPSPSPTPTPAPTVNPTSPQRALRLLGLGLDSREAETSIERIVTFGIDGQSLVSARISDASSGSIRMCLWREAAFDERECVRGRNVRLEHAVTTSGSSQWHVSMIATEQASPNVTLTIRFNADSPRVTLNNFRYAGTSFPEYNGFAARFTTLDEAGMGIDVEFEGGEAPYHFVLQAAGEAPIRDETRPPVTAFSSVIALEGGVEYSVSVRNPEEFGTEEVTFLQAMLTWP